MAGYVKDWSGVKAPGRDQRVRPSDIWEIYKIPPKHKPIRPVGPVAVMGEHWIEIKGRKGKVRIGVPCPNFDPETEAPTRDNGCPACAAGVPLALRYFTNIIDREAQKLIKGRWKKMASLRERKAKHLSLDIENRVTPVKVLVVPVSVMRTIRELEEDLNVVNGKVYPVNHPKYGRDILLRFKESASPSEMYSVSLSADHTPLSKEEKMYPLWDLSQIEEIIGDPEENIRRLEDLLAKAEEDEGGSRKSRKSGGKKKTARRAEDEEDFEVEDDVVDPDEEDEDFDEEDFDGDEDEDFDDEEEDEDEEDIEEMLNEMSRKELKKFIKERGLKIKVKKSMTDDDIREAILEELGLL